MLEFFKAFAASWPIAVMVVGVTVALVVNRRVRQAMTQDDEIRTLRASSAPVVREMRDY